MRTGREDLAHQALAQAADKLMADHWPEYYDGKSGALIGRRSNLQQTWSAAAVILADKFLEQPQAKAVYDAINF